MEEREHVTQSKAMTVIRNHGGYVYKNAQNATTERGRPDLTACVPVPIKKLIEMYGEDGEVGIFVGIEMKRPHKLKNTSLAQEVVGRQIKKAKGIWLVNDNPDELDQMLNEWR